MVQVGTLTAVTDVTSTNLHTAVDVAKVLLRNKILRCPASFEASRSHVSEDWADLKLVRAGKLPAPPLKKLGCRVSGISTLARWSRTEVLRRLKACPTSCLGDFGPGLGLEGQPGGNSSGGVLSWRQQRGHGLATAMANNRVLEIGE